MLQYLSFWIDTCPCKWNHALSEKKIKRGSIIPSWTFCNIHLQKFNCFTWSRGSNSWTTVSLYRLVARHAEVIEIAVSCASRRWRNFCGVCSNVSPTSSSFSSVSSQFIYPSPLVKNRPRFSKFSDKFSHSISMWGRHTWIFRITYNFPATIN